MTKYDKHFFEHFDIDMNRVGTLTNTITSEGVGVEKYKKQYIIFQRTSLIKESVSTFDDDIFNLMVFKDQYRDSNKPLPSLPSKEFIRQYQTSLIELNYDNSMYQDALSILRDNDISSYSQMVNLVVGSRNLVGAQYIKSSSFGENLEEWYFGDIHQYDGYKFRLNSEGFWELMHIEKGNGKAIITFYDIKYVYLKSLIKTHP